MWYYLINTFEVLLLAQIPLHVKIRDNHDQNKKPASLRQKLPDLVGSVVEWLKRPGS